MVYCAIVSKSAFFNGAATRSSTLANTQCRMVMACLLFSIRLVPQTVPWQLAQVRVCRDEHRHERSAQTLTSSPRRPPSITTPSVIFWHGFW